MSGCNTVFAAFNPKNVLGVFENKIIILEACEYAHRTEDLGGSPNDAAQVALVEGR